MGGVADCGELEMFECLMIELERVIEQKQTRTKNLKFGDKICIIFMSKEVSSAALQGEAHETLGEICRRRLALAAGGMYCRQQSAELGPAHATDYWASGFWN
jgi:hypothetical protein